MERVVASRLFALVPPVLIGPEHGFAGGRDAEVDDHGGAAGDGRLGAPLEIIGRNRAHEEQLHMRVRVDAAGKNVATAGVDDFAPGRRRYLLGDGHDLAGFDQDVGATRVVVVDNGAAANEHGHGWSSG